MTARILAGSVFDVLPTIPPGSVDAVCTSPPYWQLRSYLSKDHPLKPLELGSEPTVQEFIANMVRVFGLVRETMADHAVCFLNVGDTYANNGGGGCTAANGLGKKPGMKSEFPPQPVKKIDLDSGNLCLIPQRLAIALQDDGWIIRSVIVWCLSPSTRVYARTATTEGPATLHDLIRLDPSTVKLWNGTKWTQVRGWSTSRCEAPVRITLRSGETISSTPNHQWPLADGRLLRADELKEGDVLSTCTLPERSGDGGWGIDDDLAWFAGLYLAEGFTDDDAIRISGNAKETSRHNRVADIAETYGGTSTLRADEGDSVTQTVHSDILRGVLAHFISGKGAKGKHLHPRCWSLPNRVLQAFLNGYLAGDGHLDKTNDRWRLGFCRNDAWAADLRTLAARLGCTLTLNATYSQMGRTKTFESYRGELRFTRTGHANERDRAEIVSIGGGWAGDFIDVGVEDEPHLFALASGVLTHNSKPAPMPASVSGWMWKRCRVKVGSDRGNRNVKVTVNAQRAVASFKDERTESGRALSAEGNAQWSDCPGCEKCEPNGGLVLRRGSWRPTSSWEPILMLAKSSSYFCDGEAVSTPSANYTPRQFGRKNPAAHGMEVLTGNMAEGVEWEGNGMANPRDVQTWASEGPNIEDMTKEELLALLRSHNDGTPPDVQRWAAEPLKLAHYAAFPTALVRFCLRAGTSLRGYCPTCSVPWARILEATPETEAMRAAARNGQDFYARSTDNSHKRPEGQKAGDNPMAYVPHEQRHSVSNTIGWRPTCKCCPEQEPRPGLVLDPFAGSGRTLLTAQRMGLDAVGVELNPVYCEMSRKILREDSPLFSGGVE